jgi:signal transduction histidine kinase
MKTADPILIFLGIADLLYLLVTVLVLKKRNPQEWPMGLLLLYILTSLLLTIGQALARLGWPLSSDIVKRTLGYGLLLLSILFLQLNRSFLRLEGAGQHWWTLGLAWMATAIALNENLTYLPQTFWIGDRWSVQRQALGFGVLVSGWGLFMGGATFLTTRAYRKTQQPLHKNRITYWLLALSLTVAGAALFFAGRNFLGTAFHLLGTLSTVQLVLTYRLPDVRQATRRAASYLIVTLATAIVYAVGFLAAQFILRSASSQNPWLVGGMAALGVAILFAPLLNLIRRSVNQMVSGAGYDPSRTLREYSMSISNILDLERLAMVVVGLIGEAMRIQHGALFVVHYERDQDIDEGKEENGKGFFRLRGARALGPGGMQDLGEGLPPGTLSFDSAVATYLRLKQRPLTQYDVDLLPHFRDISPTERAWLNSLDMDVYVPIYAKGEWIGLLALGPKVSGDRYFEDDLNLLSTLADQTAVALENARLFDDLKVRNTEIERLNVELRQANRELAQLDQAKSDFIDIASHELRTPLTQVSGYNEIMNGMFKGGAMPLEQGLEMTNIIKTAVYRLKEIVQTMCDVSQLDTRTLTLNQSLLSLASVVDAAADTWAEALQERKQTLKMEGLGSLPPIVGDRKRLEQVFSHLIQNGIKYTPDGGQIRITGRLLNGRGQQVEIIVADTGIGLDVDDLERIFDKFYRVGNVLSHSSGKTKFKGAGPGLGLTIARGIVEAHGGQIWAASTGCDEDVCPGSQFHVVLPVPPHGAETTGTETLTPLQGQRAGSGEGTP